MSRMRSIRRERKEIARERIYHLFRMAEQMALRGREEYARRYVELARKIGMKYLVRMPPRYKQNFCKKCLSYFIPGKNCRVRLKKGRVVVSCLVCGKKIRRPYSKKDNHESSEKN